MCLCTIVLFLASSSLIAQNQMDNLEKYWRYRDRLRKDFLPESSDVFEMGVNIPMASIWYTGGIMNNVIKTGDGNNVRGNYLSVLATELWLLKNNGQDYSETLKELFYFMLAMERLDAYFESYIRAAVEYEMLFDWDYSNWNPNTHYHQGDINGFQIRNDADENFWDNYQSTFPSDVLNLKSTMYNVSTDGNPLEGNSQDNIINTMKGLYLLKSLVDVEDVSSIPVTYRYQHIPNYLSSKGIIIGNYVDFGLWAEDFTKRYLDYIQNDIGRLYLGSLFYILGYTPFLSKWYLWDPVRDSYVGQGAGNDGGLPLLFCHPLLEASYNITGVNLLEDPQSLPSTFGLYQSKFYSPNVNKSINKLIRKIGTLADPWPVGFPAPTLELLKAHRYHQYEEGSDGTNRVVPFEHLPLIFMILYRNTYTFCSDDYDSEMDYIKYKLNLAGECGTCSYLVDEWSASSRLNWPEDITVNNLFDVKFSGLDYMLLHNLHYLAFLLPDFEDIVDDDNYYHQSEVVVSGADIFSESSITQSSVEYRARGNIVLEPGFCVDDATFIAETGTFDDYGLSKYIYLNLTKCDLPGQSKKSAQVSNPTDTVFEEALESNTQNIENLFLAYPNPVYDDLYLTIPKDDNSKKVRVLIYNVYGQLEYDKEVVYSNNMILNLDILNRGMHILIVKYGNMNFMKKLQKL